MNNNSRLVSHLQPLFQVGLDRSEMMLETIAKSPISCQLKTLDIVSPEELLSQLRGSVGAAEISAMELSFSGDYSGMSQLIFPADSGKFLVNLIGTEDRRKLDKEQFERQIISEVGHIFFNGLMGVMSTLSNFGITYMIPKYKVGNVGQLLLSSWSKKYSVAMVGSVEVDRQRNLWFWFQFNRLDILIEQSQKLPDYFEITDENVDRL